EPRADRQFGGGEIECLARDVGRNTVELEHDAARLDPADPEFGRPLAAAHANFGWLVRHRNIRKDADPNPSGTPDVTRDRAPRRFDLAGGDPARVRRLQAIGAEVQCRPALGETMDAPLVRLAVFAAFRAQHRIMP